MRQSKSTFHTTRLQQSNLLARAWTQELAILHSVWRPICSKINMTAQNTNPESRLNRNAFCSASFSWPKFLSQTGHSALDVHFEGDIATSFALAKTTNTYSTYRNIDRRLLDLLLLAACALKTRTLTRCYGLDRPCEQIFQSSDLQSGFSITFTSRVEAQ